MKIRELLTPHTWTQHYQARDARYRPVSPDSPKAAMWCLNGAISKCYPDYPNYSRVKKLIETELGETVIDFNDADKRTFRAVKKIVDKLDV